MLIQKERITSGTRGNIFDRNGKLLAYNELSYSVTIEDNGVYESSRPSINMLSTNNREVTIFFPYSFKNSNKLACTPFFYGFQFLVYF